MFADTHNVAVAVADAGKREARYLVSCEARTTFLVPVCFSRVYIHLQCKQNGIYILLFHVLSKQN